MFHGMRYRGMGLRLWDMLLGGFGGESVVHKVLFRCALRLSTCTKERLTAACLWLIQ